METEEAAIGARPGSGPQNSEHMKFKGKEEESIRKGEKTEEETISCKIPPVYVRPGMVRGWKHDSTLSIHIFSLL